jgi:hypothetical protein
VSPENVENGETATADRVAEILGLKQEFVRDRMNLLYEDANLQFLGTSGSLVRSFASKATMWKKLKRTMVLRDQGMGVRPPGGVVDSRRDESSRVNPVTAASSVSHSQFVGLKTDFDG